MLRHGYQWFHIKKRKLKYERKQDSKDLNPRSLTNTPQTLISSKISTFSIAHKTLKCTNAPKIVNSAKAPKIPKTPEMTMNTMYDAI
jgi:hypothetical protein